MVGINCLYIFIQFSAKCALFASKPFIILERKTFSIHCVVLWAGLTDCRLSQTTDWSYRQGTAGREGRSTRGVRTLTGGAPNHVTVTPTLQHVARTCSYDWISAQVFQLTPWLEGTRAALRKIRFLYIIHCFAEVLCLFPKVLVLCCIYWWFWYLLILKQLVDLNIIILAFWDVCTC
jgi:hypothetical protein